MIAEPPIPELGRVAASAITEVLATQFKLSAIASTSVDEPIAGAARTMSHRLGDTTGGRVSGDVHLQLPEAFAAKVTALLFGRSATKTDEGRRRDRRALQYARRACCRGPRRRRLLQ